MVLMDIKTYVGIIILLVWAILFVLVGLACKNIKINPVREIKAFFKKQSTAGRFVFLLFFLVMTIYGGTKPSGGNNSTNEVGNVSNNSSVTNIGQGSFQQGMENAVNLEGIIENNSSSQQAVNVLPISFTEEDYQRGFVLTSIKSDEGFDFSPPEAGATVCEDWRKFGAATDWMYVTMTNRAFNVGTNNVKTLRVFSFGKVEPLVFEEENIPSTGYWFAPFLAQLGVVPEANEELLLEASRPSQVWYRITPYNSLIISWQNVLLERNTNKPVSFQVEFNPDGLFTYRYDLSNLDSDSITNIVAGASFAGNTWATNSLSSGVTSMTFYQLSEEDSINSDPDGDGIVTTAELFVYGTNPHKADTDFDGLSDHEELFIYETNPNNANSLNSDYYDGLAVKLGDLNPLSYQAGSTNSVLEHVFYSGTTNGVVVLPTSSEETGVLKVTVSGEGVGKLVVGDVVVPLIGPPKTRSVPPPNTLLVEIGKGKKVDYWFSKPKGLNVAIDSDDFLIGEENALFGGWIAFPHTNATHPCIHEIAKREITVSLVHGEEFPGLTATWESGQVVSVSNVPPVSAVLHAEFSRDQTGFVSYEVNHPNQLNSVKPTFEQEFRYCPPLDTYDDDDEDQQSDVEYEIEEILDPIYYECFCELYEHCDCSVDICNCIDFWCSCNASRYPTLDEDESPQSYTNLLNNVSPLPNVLYLYRDNTNAIDLEVPGGTPLKCCPCEEHWASNYVAKVSHPRRIAVKDINGENFDIAYEPCTVNVYGQRPSREFNDTTLIFVTNAVPYKQIDYTVLGVTFETPYGYAPISKYEALNASFGYPATVSTNIETATSIYIKNNVLLTNGIVKISLENATNDFAVWLPEWFDKDGNKHPPEMLLQNNVVQERYYSIEKWRKLSKKIDHSKKLELKIFSSKESYARIKFEFISSDGTYYVRDYDTLNVTTILPPLRFDITRDGSIDENDIAATLEGRDFYYWLNEDGISSLLTFTPNIDDLIINGTPDLINFFPVAIELNPFIYTWDDRVTCRIKPANESEFINYCFSDLNWNLAGRIQTYPSYTFSIDGDNISYNTILNSELKALPRWDGVIIPNTSFGRFCRGSGMMLCEATDTDDTLELEFLLDGEKLYSYVAPMKIHRVKEMYSWLNFRSVSDENIGRASVTNILIGEDYDKNLLFFHGANIDNEAAENWGDTIFKRFWVAGMKANFYNVDWRSDIGTAANYHQNVSNSFVVAQSIAPSIKAIAEEKDTIVMAHSLGNMVVSSMIQDYGLEVSKYMMVNSAVPVEAYDSRLSLRSPHLVHSDWEEYPTNSWASSWHTLFTEFENDDRKYLGWPNRFVNVASNVVNFYSSGDEVLEIASHNNVTIFTGIGFVETLSRHSWHKQELFKGRGYDILWGFTDWAGWDVRENILGINAISPDDAWTMTDADFRTNTVFNCYPESMNTNVIDIITRGAHLSYGIPALTPAAGATPFGSKEDFVIKMFNLDTDEFKSNGWVTRETYGGRWLHSDFKDVPYIFTYKFYEKVLEKGNLK